MAFREKERLLSRRKMEVMMCINKVCQNKKERPVEPHVNLYIEAEFLVILSISNAKITGFISTSFSVFVSRNVKVGRVSLFLHYKDFLCFNHQGNIIQNSDLPISKFGDNVLEKTSYFTG